MSLRRSLAFAAVFSALSLTPTVAPAQIRDIIPSELLNWTRTSGNQIRFCLNSASSLIEFDRAVASHLAEAVLLEAKFHELSYPAPPFPYEYLLPLPEKELFIQVTNNCDVVIGYPLPDDDVLPPWLTPTRPYYEPGFVLALAADAPDALADLPPGSEVGSRLGIAADIYVRSLLRASDNKLKRRVYPNNSAMLRDLASGALSAGFIWAPAIALAVQANPAANSIRVVASPVAMKPVELAIVMPTTKTFVREVLDPAIQSMRDNGALDRLLTQFGLPLETQD